MVSGAYRRDHTSRSTSRKHAHFPEPNKDKKQKKYVTTNTIFKTGPDRVRKSAKQSPKKKKGLGRSLLATRREPSSSPPPRQYTLADESNEVLNNYKAHVSEESEQTIARAYKHLVQQLEQTTLAAPNSLSSRIVSAIQDAQTICMPIGDEVVNVDFKDAEGNISRRDQQIPIRATITRFERTLKKEKDKLEQLWEEWDGVCQQIAETGAQILHDPEFPAQFGLEAMHGRSSPLVRKNPEVESLRKLIQMETERANKELDQEAADSVAAHKKYKQLWVEWLKESDN